MLHKIQCMHLTGGYSFIFLPSTETSRYYSFLPFFCIFLLINLIVSHLVVYKVTKVDWSLRTPKSLYLCCICVPQVQTVYPRCSKLQTVHHLVHLSLSLKASTKPTDYAKVQYLGT